MIYLLCLGLLIMYMGKRFEVKKVKEFNNFLEGETWKYRQSLQKSIARIQISNKVLEQLPDSLNIETKKMIVKTICDNNDTVEFIKDETE
ncbi:MAG TPA: hypothetical protein PKK99_10895 [Bacteroidia bacterium]|nr:hypothetical protein [Bacteroidia bacterium]